MNGLWFAGSLVHELRSAYDELLIDAMNLYEYNPNKFKVPAKEYFKGKIKLQKKIKKLLGGDGNV